MNTSIFDNTGKLVLRVAFSALMLTHGWGKMMLLFSGNEINFPDPIGVGSTFSLALAVFAEVVCAALIIVGFKTRLASIPLVITMLIAAFVIHGADPWGKKEFALVYMFGFLTTAFLGSGDFSLDHLLKSKKKR